MLPNLRVAFGLVFLAASPVLADIVDVTVNGTVSGTGSVTVECGVGLLNPPPGCVNAYMGLYLDTIPFSFSATNSDRLLFGTSELEAPGPYGPNPLLQAFPYQTTRVDPVGPGTLEIDLGDIYSLSTGAAITNFLLNENDSFSATFDLTEASMVSLSFDAFGEATGSGELLDSGGNVLVTLPSVGGATSPDLLEPGSYQLDLSLTGGVDGPFTKSPGYFQASLGLAAYPIATPEPRGLVLAALLSMALGSWGRRARWRRPAS